MTSQEKAESWIKESGRTQAIVDCKRAIEKLEKQMDKNGYTPADLKALREYKDILFSMQTKKT